MSKQQSHSDQVLNPIGDSPLVDPSMDELDRRPFAEALVRAIERAPLSDGFVIGLHAPWGDGKSTVLNFVAVALADRQIPCLRYNPWRFSDESQMIRGLIKQITTVIGKPDPKLRALAVKYGDAVSTIVGVFDETAGRATAKVTAHLESDLEQQHDKLVNFMRKAPRRVAVLIDDIDRLDHAEIFTLLRIVKACADLPGLVYVLAFDDAVVAEALQARYANAQADSGRRFLEKIVQMPLSLPPADPVTLERKLRSGIDRILSALDISLGQSDESRFHDLFSNGLRPAIQTPRQVKQYLNAASFALAALTGEANLTDVLMVEGLRALYPGVYSVVRTNQDLLCGGPMREEGIVVANKLEGKLWRSAALQSLRVRERLGVEHLLRGLFPRLALDSTRPGISPVDVARWEHHKRICAPSYCSRYFAYTVGSNDVPDAALDAILQLAERSESAVLEAEVSDALRPQRQRATMARLKSRVMLITPNAAARLIPAMSNRSHDFAEPFSLAEKGFGMEAAARTAFLLRRVNDQPRQEQLVDDIVQQTPALWFAALVWKHIQPQPIQGSDELHFSFPSAVVDAAGMALAARIDREQRERGLVFLAPHRRWPFEILQFWRQLGGAAQIDELLIPGMKSDRTMVSNLLACLTQPTCSKAGEIPEPGELTWEHVVELQEYIDVSQVADAIRSSRMRDLKLEPAQWIALPRDLRHLSQFMHYVTERGILPQSERP